MTIHQIMSEINSVLAGEDNKAVKISKILILISGNNDYKFNRIMVTLQNVIPATLDIAEVEDIFKSKTGPNEKVGAFINLLAKGDPVKYNAAADILAS